MTDLIKWLISLFKPMQPAAEPTQQIPVNEPAVPVEAPSPAHKVIDLSRWDLVPELVPLAAEFLDKCKNAGYDLRITQGRRTAAQQAALYAQGRTAPGAIVTNANVGQSYHETGKAFDVCFEGLVAYPSDDAHWKAIADIGISVGLTAGYYFHSIKDRPHFQI